MSNEDLVGFVESLSGESHLRVQDDLGDGFVRLRAAEAQRRQAKQDIRSFEDVVVEMMRNSRDAGAHSLFVATWKEEGVRQLTIIDDGQGIPLSHHELVFEPFVTSKLDTFHSDRWGVHGRGMALYSIRENVDEARIALSAPGLGSSFIVRASSEKLPEKRDQSSLPVLASGDGENLVLRGPHNIVRAVLEFAIDERQSMTVYFGSPTEVAASLFHLSRLMLSKLDSKVALDENSVPYFLRFCFADDPASFASIAAKLGLPMSERSARRIMDGQIEARPPLLDSFFASHSNGRTSEVEQPLARKPESRDTADGITNEPLVGSDDARNNEKGSSSLGEASAVMAASNLSRVKIDESDLGQLSAKVMDAYATLAGSYYLDPAVCPMVKVSKGHLNIRIPLVDQG